MTEDALKSAVADISTIAKRHGGILRATIGPPADDNALQRCEEYLGTALPPSEHRLLRLHDGISLEVFSKDQLSRLHAYTEPACRLKLNGTADIRSRTE